MTKGQAAKKKILIVDSGMKNLGGHNFSYTRAVQQALAERGYETEVLANKMLLPELAREFGYKPAFAHGAYDFPPEGKNIRQVLSHIYAQSVIYADELDRELKNKLSDYAAVFSHTAGDFEIIGWNRFLGRQRLDAHLFLLMRWTPGFRRMNSAKRMLHPYLRIKPAYLNSIRSKLNERFTLLTDSELLTRDYAAAYRHRIVTMPIPINKYFLAAEKDYLPGLNDFKARYGLNEKRGLCIGYMGDVRGAKGFHLLPALVRSLLEKTPDVHFAIQCPKSASGDDYASQPAGVAELREIAEKAGNRVTLVSERLSEADYANMFRSLDVCLIPYLLPGYTEPTSGIFAEAVALGIPTIVTEKTWMAHELKKFEGGLEIKSDNAQDLEEKVFRLIENYPDFREKAQAFAAKWSEFHNSGKLAELLVGEIER